MKPRENKTDVAVIEQPGQGDMKKGMEYFRQQVVQLTREVFGEEKSIVFASGVMAGIELGKRKLENAVNAVFPDDSDMSPEEDNRHTLACMHLSDVVSDWPVEKIERLGSYLEDHSLEDILQLQIA